MPAPKKQKFHAYPFWSPRFWHGMTFGEWMKFWAKNHFRSHPLRFPMAFLISCVTPFNSVMGWVQDLFYGKKINETELVAPPVFIIGHWRSGTTFLHELMFL